MQDAKSSCIKFRRSQVINGKVESTVFYHPLAPRFFIFA